jgi:hypothetical protein
MEGRVPVWVPSKTLSFWPLAGTFVPSSGQKEKCFEGGEAAQGKLTNQATPM